MQIKNQDKKIGLIELIPETIDDLWHLSHIVEKNDYISTLTTRRIQDNNSGKTRADRGVKKTFYLGVRVEKISFHKYTGMLRFTGIIESGPEELVPIGSYHTINVQINNSIKIQKNWNKWSLDRLNLAIEASKRPTEIIVAMEDNTTDLGIIKQYGIEYVGPIIGDISGKRNIQKDRNEKINQYYEDVTQVINQHGPVNKLIIIGPGFTKNGYYNYLEEYESELCKKAILESTGAGGHAGIQEVLKNGLIESLSKDAKIASETSLVNKLLEQIGKSSDMVTYGQKQVSTASNMGASEKLLVLDNLVKEKNIQNIMNITENMGGTVVIISSEHDAGKQLEALGSIAVFLRYPI
ncbi:mRNA surveillance protein pelota [Methanosphaera sp. WGK6]|uniref:mRNA surveillance protein pelota n=1 Tax=Methanosphaera sp. WGK6 TaxID=1561964 RepID=UPI00084C069C|nr:mRNA surveillance protein pelota [Methanosphaera sp. WGK6]OED30509.1 mRNA surveillance protein Pelota [Methanosphaera sp. WGK6]